MNEDFECSQGLDLLGFALNREPGASDFDEFVSFEVYFDGTRGAADGGQALPFLRARLCEAFEILAADLDRYLWHRDRFVLEVELGKGTHDEPHLFGHMRTGDGSEDEWFVLYLLQKLTAARGDASCRVLDNDGEFLLIEAALAAPRWLNPDNAEHRCWLRGGAVHILPRPRPPEPQKLPCHAALARLRSPDGGTTAKEKVQHAINARLDGYPRRAVELSQHVARAVLPTGVARLLVAYPQLVSVAVDYLPPPPPRELVRWRRQLSEEEAGIHLDCEGPPEQETVCVGVRFTRCQYARLTGLRCELPQRFGQKRWRPPQGVAAPDEKAMRRGALLCAGLEAAYLQGPTSATAVLRWPSATLAKELVPSTSPWLPDAAFARHAAALQPALNPDSVAARRAFAQQSELEGPFRRAFLAALSSDALSRIELTAHWRDHDDTEEWLDVSAEELDKEMQARQAEFDAYDKKHTQSGHASGVETAANDAEKDPAILRENLAEMGQEISGLLGRASRIDGVDPAAGDSDSSNSDVGEYDVLGMEDAREGEEFHEYMAELDEQLGQELDGDLPEADETEETSSKPGSLPLGSRHVKVHGVEPIDLDVHAMEHVLASYCTEHQLEPGPASVLLRELGLASAAAAGAGHIGPGASGKPVMPSAITTCALDSMD